MNGDVSQQQQQQQQAGGGLTPQIQDGLVYKLHKIIAIRSPYLASLIQESEMRGENYNPTEIIIPISDPNITAESLSIAIGHLYANYTPTILSQSHSPTSPTTPTDSEQQQHRSQLLRGVLAASCLLHLPDLSTLVTSLIKSDINQKTVNDYCQFVSQPEFGSSYGIGVAYQNGVGTTGGCWSSEIRDCVFGYLCRGLVRELAERSPVWGNKELEGYRELVNTFAELPFDWLKKVVESKDAFEVPNEMERFSFAKDVVALRSKRKSQKHHPSSAAFLAAGEENVLLAFGGGKAGSSGVTIVRKAPKMMTSMSNLGAGAGGHYQHQQQQQQQQQHIQLAQQMSHSGSQGGLNGLGGGAGAGGRVNGGGYVQQERRVWKASS
ncbi:hypothetical protein HDU76_012853 [Blyttiomyces sp. JEL0837]|nr:hypothetical protein HDU76_012853 [Blyttiomyces sp. JEL0837]